jgi:dienelactone hydrolase
MRRLLCVLALGLCAFQVQAAMIERPVDYSIDGREHRGYVIYDDAVKTQRPLLLLVPNWLGTTSANRQQAAEVAGQRYVVMVVDMYGRDQQPADSGAAGKAVSALYGDRAELRKRIAAAQAEALRAALEKNWPADVRRVGAIGFCFGGATVLELARSGADVAAVVSLHGNLALEAEARNQPIRARVLALHGDADPYVPEAQVQAFVGEMRSAGADWQLVRYGGAVHSFTDPAANTPGKSQYDARTARRAFALMHEFLAEAFR